MTITQEATSWLSPPSIPLSPAPVTGQKAPSCPQLPQPAENGKPTVISFLRHCGCPAAFFNLRAAAEEHPEINFVAVSHSDRPSTEKWVEAVGGAGKVDGNPVRVVVDAERKVYAQWGLGITSWGHVLNPSGLVSIWKLGRERGIWNRPTESGSRWQLSGNWAVDAQGVVRWGGAVERVDELMDVGEAVECVRG
ncbi:hypothetical protein BO71DRAFT_15563 [Aspergillus ellipticus CBS 707.79]|uniref:Thioredoxin domain-containing protein n=1 Tax=Aspergillus ellipticus CBS 707.79 TaxID=1448320 RepID=A0A319DF36_9EURO|nr:hypothetical protein BO71DRAFT_15563 [Aspergillus ellipticus CBS 707.79]